MAVWSVVELSRLTDDFRLDAEHYQPAYLEQEQAMSKLPHDLLGRVANVSDGNHLSIADYFDEQEGVRYLRGQDLSDFFISDADPIFIPDRIYTTLQRSHMHPGDVLVGIVGTIGSVGLVTDRHGHLTGNCKLAIVRSSSLPAEYLAAYLGSQVGQFEIQRRIRGSVQMGLILPDLKRIPILVPPDSVMREIVGWVKEAQAYQESSRRKMSEAEAMLVAALGLQKLDLSPSLFYERQFTDLIDGGRFGSEYFMPCKSRAQAALRAQAGSALSDHYYSAKELFDPRAVREAGHVRNFDLSDALDPVLDESKQPSEIADIGSTKKHIQTGDVVISKLRSYLREIALVRLGHGGRGVCSTEFLVFRATNPKKQTLKPETLLVFLRSAPVQAVLKWSQDGTQHPRFNEAELLSLWVPDAVRNASADVEAAVSEALQLRARGRDRLAQAMRAVELAVPQKAGREVQSGYRQSN